MVWIGFISICCSKVAKEGKSCPRLLVLQRVAQNAKSCSKVAEHNLFMPIPDATQISAMVGVPTNENSNLYRQGRRRWISLITNPLNCWAPVPRSHINMDRLLAIIRYIGKFWNSRQKVKSPIVWDFPYVGKPGFMTKEELHSARNPRATKL